jgi:hypothetical protein
MSPRMRASPRSRSRQRWLLDGPSFTRIHRVRVGRGLGQSKVFV